MSVSAACNQGPAEAGPQGGTGSDGGGGENASGGNLGAAGDSNGDGDASGGSGGGGGGGGTGGESNSGGSTAGGATASGGADGGTPSLACSLVWSSGFENGFPGEFLNYDDGAWSEDGTVNPGRVNAWTIIDRASGEPVYSGDHAYKGWIVDSGNESHRAYPVVHTDIETPLINTFMAYLELDYDELADAWVHFGTWGNQDDDGVGSWALHTMSVLNRELEFAHSDPPSGEYIGPEPEPEFPLGKWVRFTVYIHYEGDSGFVQVWQDGVPMLRGGVPDLAEDPSTAMRRTHWGMYADGRASSGVQYNDDIAIWTLSEPLTNFEAEPDCYLEQR